MNSSPVVMKAVEQLDYRVTVGDVATQAGLDINMAQAGLLTLASEAGGHLQVAATGEVVYLFPKDFRSILRNKFFWLQVQELWAKIWRVLFYIIRISFGIVLVASILLMVAAIVVIIIAASASKDNDNDNGGGSSGGFGMPNIWFNPFSIFWYSDPYYRGDYHQPQRQSSRGNRSRQNATDEPEAEMNFLMSVFSFIFGDGDPNFDLEEKRWQLVGKVIANNNGAVVAEQIAPYLDKVDGDEDYIIPVLARFNGYPQVSPEGDLIYHFPELQTFAQQRRPSPVPAYLKEEKWKFSRASSGQLTLAGGLGVVNIIAAIVLGSLLQGGEIAAQLGGFVAFVNSIFGILVAYGVGFLAIPLIRYGLLQLKNQGINSRNNQRQQQATRLNRAGDEVQRKLSFAQQFAAQNIIGAEDLAYTTETDLLDQEINQKVQIDADWQRRLEQNTPPKHPKNDDSL